jgi:ATP-dependent helicase HrpB
MAALVHESRLMSHPGEKEGMEARRTVLSPPPESDLIGLARLWRHVQNRQFPRPLCRSLGLHPSGAIAAGRMQNQLLKIARQQGLDTERDQDSEEALSPCLLAGFSDQVARCIHFPSRRYEMVHGRRGTLDRSSLAAGKPLIVVQELLESQTRRGGSELRFTLAAPIRPEWLASSFPEDLSTQRDVFFDPKTQRVCAKSRLRFRDLIVEERPGADPERHEAAPLLARQIQEGNVRLEGWDQEVEAWIARVNLVANACPETSIRPILDPDRAWLIEWICQDAVSFKEIRARPILPAARGLLSPAQASLVETLAPQRLDLSNGRTAKVHYEPGKPPYIAMRIQDLYGVEEALAVAKGRVPILVQVLAPNFRPVQITSNLASFWKNGYVQARKELKGRYPKHEWR